MAAIEVESVEDDSPAKNPEDSGHISWNNNQTSMLIAHFKDNPILWDKQLKDNANRHQILRSSITGASSSIIIIKITSSFLFRSKSFQSKAAARAPLLMAAILIFPVHEHKEFWSLSLIGSTFDSVSGTCCMTVHTKFHGILATFCPRDVSHEVQQAELCATCSWDKISPKLVLHK
jgi:hypothetical protein